MHLGTLEKLELLRSAYTNKNTWQIHMELLEKSELLRVQIQIQILEKYIWNCLKSCNFWEVQIQIQILDKYIWNCLKSCNFWEVHHAVPAPLSGCFGHILIPSFCPQWHFPPLQTRFWIKVQIHAYFTEICSTQTSLPSMIDIWIAPTLDLIRRNTISDNRNTKKSKCLKL